jgi:hypothetical protein
MTRSPTLLEGESHLLNWVVLKLQRKNRSLQMVPAGFAAERLTFPASGIIGRVEERTLTRERKMEEPMMTEAQRDELKTLCQKADVPDKSGELLTREGAQHFIENLKKQLAERK